MEKKVKTPLKFIPEYLSVDRQLHSAKQRLVLGTASLGGVWGEVDPNESVDTLLYALECGVEALDTAPAYSNAEIYVGKALQQWKGKRPIVSTKVGRLKTERADISFYDYSADGLRRSIENSLRLLGVHKIDILFLHDPIALSQHQASKAIETLLRFKQEGLMQKIGIGGNYPKWFEAFIDENVFSICMGYNRLDASCLNALNNEIPFLQEKKIKFYAASPLHMGLLGNKLQQYQQKKEEWITDDALKAALYLNQLSVENGLSLPEIALKFLKAFSIIDKVVIGPRNKKQFEDCFNCWIKGTLPQKIFNSITAIHQKN